MTDTTTSPTSVRPVADTGPEQVETVIIGAGQAGLATAYHLQRAGRRYVVLERSARIGDQWRRRYASLVLNTPARYDALPGLRFPAPPRSFPTAGQLADYLEEYARHHRLHVHCGLDVASVSQADDGSWTVVTDGGTYQAQNVVVATGGDTHPRVPALAEQIDPGVRQMHSSAYREPGQLLPGPVLVVGLGQSGADIALEAANAGHEVRVSGAVRAEVPIDIESRRGRVFLPVLWFAWTHLLTERTPPGRRARAGIRSGKLNAPLLRVKRRHLDQAGVHRTDERTTDVVDGKPALADGTVLDVANIVWCTGYRQDFSFIHPSPVGEDGWPRDRGGVMPDVPGLYFMGLLFQRGFYSMLIGGAGRDARHVARHILARSRVSRGTAA
ncbi:MAG TPA: NAD(P)/FAD-dependent oxidoreductase [Nocardioides sp.]|jgi:putative flavoprotein involved in K+ transport|nr:NAD(P)/FAD-dependent oxidoreductase [Nocardioides sp.]